LYKINSLLLIRFSLGLRLTSPLGTWPLLPIHRHLVVVSRNPRRRARRRPFVVACSSPGLQSITSTTSGALSLTKSDNVSNKQQSSINSTYLQSSHGEFTRRVHMEMERREKVYLSIIFPGRKLRIGFISAYHPMHVTLTGATLWTIWSLEPRSEGKQRLSCPNAIATVQ